jgi:hypothetical protein
MSGEFSVIVNEIKKGMRGENLWIPVKYPALRNQIGISKRLYHLIGGDPGSGKTSWVDSTYIMDAHHWCSQNTDKAKLKTIYFSMERSSVYKKSKWLAHRLYTQDNILRSLPDILSWGTSSKPMSEQLLSVVESHQDYFDKLFEDVHIIDGTNNPTGIYKTLYRVALQNGTIYGRDEHGKYYKTTLQSWERKKIEERRIYITQEECPVELRKPYDKEYLPNDPKLIIQVVVDHIGKVTTESGLNEKQTIDKASEYLAFMRDFFGMAIVVISQFNRNNANIQRRINTDLTPEQQDFKGSGNTYEDADVVLGLFNPHKHGLTTYKGYNINQTKQNGFSRFRSMTLMKNSYGVDNLIAAFRFVGECGAFDQIVGKGNEINYEIFNINYE